MASYGLPRTTIYDILVSALDALYELEESKLLLPVRIRVRFSIRVRFMVRVRVRISILVRVSVRVRVIIRVKG
jgi:hypothetical protein